MFKVYTLLSFLTLTGLYAHYDFLRSRNETHPLPLAASQTANGAADPATNYKNYCAGCHGDQMNAFVDRKWKHGNTAADLFKAIKVGYPDEGMPGFDTTFTDSEINDLVEYILTGIKNVDQYHFPEKPTSNLFRGGGLTIRLDTVARGLAVPWGMAFLPGGDLLVTERGGTLYRVTRAKKMIRIEGVPEVVAEGQGGLMDVELHPNFKSNGFVYLSYSIGKKTDKDLLSTTAVTRAVLRGNRLVSHKRIFEALPYSRTRHHYGSRLEFGKDGLLYITVGDRGNEKENPQNLAVYPGKTHRLRDDGSIPKDNPFVKTPGALPSIFSYGHRNQQGMVIHPRTGEIWTHEHGPRGGDEINIVQKGKNFGWPVISFGINYNGTVLTDKTTLPGMEQPMVFWLPSIGPSGMAFVQGTRYKGWEGQLLVGSLRFRYLNLCRIRNGKVVDQEMLLRNVGRVRDVRMGPDGYIYVSVENPGAVLRLLPVKG